MADFTLFTKLNYISPSEMALVIMGYDHETQMSTLDDETEQGYRALSRAISRNVNYIDNKATQSTKKITDADIVLCAAYPFIIDGVTPSDAITRIDHAIAKLTRRRGWRELLEALGGDALLMRGKELHMGGRGEHRKNDEDESNYKIIGLLLRMVADKGLAKYGEFSEPVISEIYRDLSELCNKYGINMKGLAESTFYKKAKKSQYYIDE